MVLKVFSHAGQVVHDVDAESSRRCRSDAGGHQQLRRIEYARARSVSMTPAFATVTPIARPAVELDAKCLDIGQHDQIGASAVVRGIARIAAVQKGPRRVPAFAVVLRHLIEEPGALVARR